MQVAADQRAVPSRGRLHRWAPEPARRRRRGPATAVAAGRLGTFGYEIVGSQRTGPGLRFGIGRRCSHGVDRGRGRVGRLRRSISASCSTVGGVSVGRPRSSRRRGSGATTVDWLGHGAEVSNTRQQQVGLVADAERLGRDRAAVSSAVPIVSPAITSPVRAAFCSVTALSITCCQRASCSCLGVHLGGVDRRAEGRALDGLRLQAELDRVHRGPVARGQQRDQRRRARRASPRTRRRPPRRCRRRASITWYTDFPVMPAATRREHREATGASAGGVRRRSLALSIRAAPGADGGDRARG